MQTDGVSEMPVRSLGLPRHDEQSAEATSGHCDAALLEALLDKSDEEFGSSGPSSHMKADPQVGPHEEGGADSIASIGSTVFHEPTEVLLEKFFKAYLDGDFTNDDDRKVLTTLKVILDVDAQRSGIGESIDSVRIHLRGTLNPLLNTEARATSFRRLIDALPAVNWGVKIESSVLSTFASRLFEQHGHPIFGWTALELKVPRLGLKFFNQDVRNETWPLPFIGSPPGGEAPARPSKVAMQSVAMQSVADDLKGLVELVLADFTSGEVAGYSSLIAVHCSAMILMTYFGMRTPGVKTSGAEPEQLRRMGFDMGVAPVWRRLCEMSRQMAQQGEEYWISERDEARALNAMLAVQFEGLGQPQDGSIPGSGEDDSQASHLAGAIVSRDIDGTVCRSVAIVLGPMPPAFEGFEKEILNCFEALRSPQKLVQLPDLCGIDSKRRTIEQEFPWALEAIEEIFGEIEARRAYGGMDFGFSPILVVGRPGCGKTRLARRLSEVFGAPIMSIPLGGVCDSRGVAGTARGWSTGRPSPILQFMLEKKTANCVVLLDELDKVTSSDHNGSTSSVLLGLTERESSLAWRDAFLLAPCNMSHLSYVATGNSLSRIPDALQTRFRAILMPDPDAATIRRLGGAVAADIAKSWSLPAEVFDGIWQEAPVREVENFRQMQRAMRDHLKRWGRERMKGDKGASCAS